VYSGVHDLHRLGCPVGLLLRPVGNQVERAQRANEAPPEIASNLGVVENAGGDE
jgi:hypothetical protein